MKTQVRVKSERPLEGIAEDMLYRDIQFENSVYTIDGTDIVGLDVITFELERQSGPFASKVNIAEVIASELSYEDGIEEAVSVEADKAKAKHDKEIAKATAKFDAKLAAEGITREEWAADIKRMLEL